MQIKITRIDKTLELPKHETSGSVGFDFLTREDATIDPGEIQLIPANVIIEVPPGYMLMVALRSSTPRKIWINDSTRSWNCGSRLLVAQMMK